VINGYFTVESDWSVVKNKYLTKFFIAGITFYGLQTIQGPSQGIRVVSSLIHYTDWVPGHVHMGTMGWVTMVICASIYYIIPIFTKPRSTARNCKHPFWIVLIGQLMFSITMWITGIQQGAMWKMTNPDGSLKYTFIETVVANYPYWQMRTVAGVIFVIGMLFFLYNVFMTIQKGKKALAVQPAPVNA